MNESLRLLLLAVAIALFAFGFYHQAQFINEYEDRATAMEAEMGTLDLELQNLRQQLPRVTEKADEVEAVLEAKKEKWKTAEAQAALIEEKAATSQKRLSELPGPLALAGVEPEKLGSLLQERFEAIGRQIAANRKLTMDLNGVRNDLNLQWNSDAQKGVPPPSVEEKNAMFSELNKIRMQLQNLNNELVSERSFINRQLLLVRRLQPKQNPPPDPSQ